MAVRIIIAGLVAAAFGTTVAVSLGLNLASTLAIYGLFGLCGGSAVCLASLLSSRNLGQQGSRHNRTAG